MSQHSLAFIGLGSNLDKPAEQIQRALDSMATLPDCSELQCAPWYSSKAIGPAGQPDYINTVASLKTQLSPLALLHQLQAIENQQGRQRHIRWGARTLDLDLLVYDNVCLDTDELQVPHPEIHKRNFVLLPLYKLAPALVLPDGRDLKALVAKCDMNNLKQIQQPSSK